MLKLKAIVPDSDKLGKEIWKSVNKQALEAYEEQINRLLRDVQCPVHNQVPTVRLDPVDLSRSPRALSYNVQSPCCGQLVEEVEKKLGTEIQLTYR